jgi:hypothetical protein
MKVNWNLILDGVEQLKGSSETLHDLDFVKEIVSYVVLASSTSIVETGACCGVTTRFLSLAFSGLPYFTCDLFYPKDILEQNLAGCTNVTHKLMDTRDFLQTLGGGELGARPFFFLDAHIRNAPNPLVKELEIILEKLRNTAYVDAGICIHDFKVEDRPEFGYNASEYDGTDLCWETIKFIEPYAKAVWFPFESPKTHNPRGRVFIYLSVLQPALPFSLSYLENLGILKRFI